MNDEQLAALFAEAGTVTSAKVIMDRESGRSKGFGFVEMSTPEEAQAAIAKFSGKEVDGRRLTVNLAKPMADRPARPSFDSNRPRY
jgi:cold-inducible RNA-binding protein